MNGFGKIAYIHSSCCATFSSFLYKGNLMGKRLSMLAKREDDDLYKINILCYGHIDIARPCLIDNTVKFPRVCHWRSTKSCHNREWSTEKLKTLSAQLHLTSCFVRQNRKISVCVTLY